MGDCGCGFGAERGCIAESGLDETAGCGCLDASGVTEVGLVEEDAICDICPAIAAVEYGLIVLELGKGADGG